MSLGLLLGLHAWRVVRCCAWMACGVLVVCMPGMPASVRRVVWGWAARCACSLNMWAPGADNHTHCRSHATRLYESWLVQDYCDAGSLADVVSSSSSSAASQPPGSGTASGSGNGRLARLRASICCSSDPEQRMLGNLLCLLDVASGLDYLHSCCNMVGSAVAMHHNVRWMCRTCMALCC